ncbi:hypothetical protein OROMI_018407 [Orobanche minor]
MVNTDDNIDDDVTSIHPEGGMIEMLEMMNMTPTRGCDRRGGSSTSSSRQSSSSCAEPDIDDLTLLGSDDGSNIERDGRITLRRNAQGH